MIIRKYLAHSDNSPEAQARREEERRKKEEAKEAEYIRQQEVLLKRRTGEWRNVCMLCGVAVFACVDEKQHIILCVRLPYHALV